MIFCLEYDVFLGYTLVSLYKYMTIINPFKKYYYMTKQKKHEKAEAFRREIAMPAQRAAAIRDLTSKTVYDESDELRLTILLQKTDYLQGCESEYAALVSKVAGAGSEKMKSKALDFFKRWHG